MSRSFAVVSTFELPVDAARLAASIESMETELEAGQDGTRQWSLRLMRAPGIGHTFYLWLKLTDLQRWQDGPFFDDYPATLEVQALRPGACKAILSVCDAATWKCLTDRPRGLTEATVRDWLTTFWDALTQAQPATPAPTLSPAVKLPRQPYIPRRAADLRRWRAVWVAIAPDVRQGMAYADVLGQLGRRAKLPQCSEDTLRKIIAAGEAHALD